VTAPRFAWTALAVVALAAPARADFLSFLAYQTASFQLKTNVQLIVTDLAVAPTGETMLAACEVGTNNVLILKVWFYNAAGTLVAGPTTVVNSGSIENMTVGAGPTAFCIAYDATGVASDTVGKGVFFKTFTLAGAPLSAASEIMANVQTNLDERSPAVAGYPTATGTGFVITWVRRSLTTAVTTGLWGRRFNGNGTPIDLADVRIDANTDNRIANPKVATWPNGRFVVSWTDGLAFPATSVLSNGTGIFARIMEPSFAFRTPQFQVPQAPADDQFQSFVSCDHNGAFVCGWSGFVNNGAAVEGFARRYSDTGVALDALDIDVSATAATGGHLLQGVAMAASGEWTVVMDALGPSAGFTTARSKFQRYAPNRGTPLLEDGYLDGVVSPDVQSQSRVAVDQWGAARFCYVLDTGSALALQVVKTKRTMLQYDNPLPPVGSTVTCYLDSPNTPNGFYIMGCAFGTGPIAVDYRKLPLSADPLLLYSLDGTFASIFQNFAGSLDAQGQSTTPTIAIPNDPTLTGFTLYCAFGVVVPGWLSNVGAISDAEAFTLQ
jgi:hypothetical protein